MSIAKVVGKAIVIETPIGERFLVVGIDIECAICGGVWMQPTDDGRWVAQFAGHHVRAVRDLLSEFIEQHPDLVDTEAQTTTLGRKTYQINPEQN